MAAFSPAEAVSLYRSALALAGAAGVSQGEKAVLLSDLAESQDGAGDFEGAIQGYEEAAAEFEAAGDVAGAARAYRWLAAYPAWQGQLEQALRFAEKGLELVGPADRGQRASLLAYHAEVSWILRRFDTVLEEADEAESLAEHVTDRETLGWPFNGLAWLYAFACFPQKARESGDRAAAEWEGAGELAIACMARLIGLFSLNMQGRLSAAGPEWADFRRLSEQRLNLQAAYTAALCVAWQRLMAGELVESERIGEEVLTLASEMRIIALVPQLLQLSAMLMTLTRRYDEAEARLAVLQAVYEGTEMATVLAGPWPGRIGLCLEKGDAASARNLLADRPKGPFEEPLSMGGSQVLLACGEALAELGETDGLDACYQRLRELNERGVEIQMPWPCLVPRVIAMLDAVSGRWDDATTYFEKALTLARRLGSRLELAATLLAYARMRLTRDAPGDAEVATAMLNEALQLNQDMGLTQRVEKVLALKLRAQGIDTSDVQTSIDAVAASVYLDKPDLRQHAAPDGTVTILFTDIEGSTAMT